jgi:hypothetical protein
MINCRRPAFTRVGVEATGGLLLTCDG